MKTYIRSLALIALLLGSLGHAAHAEIVRTKLLPEDDYFTSATMVEYFDAEGELHTVLIEVQDQFGSWAYFFKCKRGRNCIEDVAGQEEVYLLIRAENTISVVTVERADRTDFFQTTFIIPK